MNRYFQRREEGNARTLTALENRPFTCFLGFGLMMSLVAAAVYLAVFTDSKEEFSRHSWQSIGVIAVLTTVLVFFFSREKRGPLPLALRRLLWRAILWGYIGVALYFVSQLFQPYGSRLLLFRSLIGLGPVLPLPVIAWQLLRKNDRG